MASSKTTSRFAGRNFSFRDVVIEGKHGGRKGLVTYLQRRVSQLTRDLSGAVAADRPRYLRAIVAMNDAVVLIEKSGSAGPVTGRRVSR